MLFSAENLSGRSAGRMSMFWYFQIRRWGQICKSHKTFGVLDTYPLSLSFKLGKSQNFEWSSQSQTNIPTSPENRYDMRWLPLSNCHHATNTTRKAKPQSSTTNKITPQPPRPHLNNTSWTQIGYVSTLRAAGMRPKQVFARNSAHRKGGERSANMFCWCYVRNMLCKNISIYD